MEPEEINQPEEIIANQPEPISHQDLIDKFSPFFYLHSDEKYFPITMDFYIKNCQLYHKKNTKRLVKDFGELTMENLIEPAEINGRPRDPLTSKNFKLNPKREIVKPNKNLEKLKKVKIYSKVNEFDDYYQILYIVIFANNPGYKVFGKIRGKHDFDLEHITVKVRKSDLELRKIFYSAHGSREGVWVKPNDFKMLDGHPVVFVAKGSHAFYRKSGTHKRILALANDVCDKGTLWKPDFEIISDETNWVRYFGQYYMKGGKSLIRRGFWKNEKSTNELGFKHTIGSIFMITW